MIEFLSKIPFWIWVIIPALILGIIVYFITKKTKNSIVIALAAMGAAWLTAGFHFFEVYLHNHFIGGFDQYGLPGNFSHTGWKLMIDSWPIWLIPSIVIAIFVQIIIKLYKNYQVKLALSLQEKADKETTTEVTPSLFSNLNSAEIAHQLELQQLKIEIKNLKKELKNNLKGTGISAQGSSVSQELLDDLQNENIELNSNIELLKKDINKAKILITKLFEDREED